MRQFVVSSAVPRKIEEEKPKVIVEEKRVIYRAGNLPKDLLPNWFEELDKDKDAQVGFYEWKAGNYDYVSAM